MKLNKWLESFPVLEVFGKTDLEIRGIASDSRKVTPGSLFVALTGSKQDGRQFIPDAIERGAIAIVTEGPIMGRRLDPSLQEKVTCIRVKNAREALPHLASRFFGNPAEGFYLIGVTGTNGKTTTTFLIRALLQAADFKAGLLGTIRYDLGGGLRPATHTTPGLLELQDLFLEMRNAGTTHVVMEVSSHALDQGRVAGCRFEVTAFTNLTQDHLDYHKTMDHYFASKRKLFDQTEGRAVINIDDLWGRQLARDIPGRYWGYGIEHRGEFYPKSMVSDRNGIRMTVKTPLGEIDLESPLLGRYNVYNILASVGVGVALDLSSEAISSGIASMTGVPGRFERIDLGQEFLVIVDYAHTEDALARLLSAVSDLSPRNIITVFGCGGDRDRGKRPRMGAVSARLSHRTILTSDNPRSESPLSIIQEIEAGLRMANPSAGYEVIQNRREAIDRAIALAQERDAVVIAGKGHEDYQIVGDERLPFNDCEVARAVLTERLGQI